MAERSIVHVFFSAEMEFGNVKKGSGRFSRGVTSIAMLVRVMEMEREFAFSRVGLEQDANAKRIIVLGCELQI